MLNCLLTFFIFAIVAGVLSFGGLAKETVSIAKILFLAFIVLFAVSFITGRRTGV